MTDARKQDGDRIATTLCVAVRIANGVIERAGQAFAVREACACHAVGMTDIRVLELEFRMLEQQYRSIEHQAFDKRGTVVADEQIGQRQIRELIGHTWQKHQAVRLPLRSAQLVAQSARRAVEAGFGITPEFFVAKNDHVEFRLVAQQ